MMKFIVLYLSLVYTVSGFAQESVNVAGGTGTGSGGTTSFSVGQVAYTGKSGSGGVLNEGVQQTFVVLDSVNALNEATFEFDVKVFPNPTTDILSLDIVEFEGKDLSYSLYDVNQNLLISEEIHNTSTFIEFSNYASGSYVLMVFDRTGTSKYFRVVKY